jgi:hypothetical protein
VGTSPAPPAFISTDAWQDHVPAGTGLVPVPPPDIRLGRDALSRSAAEQHEFAMPEGLIDVRARRGIESVSR